MRPVDQTKLYTPEGGHTGNCFPACIASIMDMQLWMVPPFENMFQRDYLERVEEWLNLFGKSLRLGTEETDFDSGFYYIASGRSPRGVLHSVVYLDGKLAHDPHPSRLGIKSVEYIYRIIPKEKK